MVVLSRIQDRVDKFLSPSKSGFRRGRGTIDDVWAHRWIAAKSFILNVFHTSSGLIYQKHSIVSIELNFWKY